MKNFGKLVVGGLLLASLGVTTSCVDDEVSEEVKAIYQNQAAFLAAQTSLIKAEADLEAARAVFQQLLNQAQEAQNAAAAAQNALAILNAENALELAREEHLKALLQLKLEVQATKSEEAEKYLGKYLAETGIIIGLESDVEAQKRDLAKLNAAVIDGVFDKEEAVSLKNIEIAQLESQLTKDEDRLALLKAVLSEPTSVGAQVIAIQKQIDELIAGNKERNSRITEIRSTELPEFGDNIAAYQDAKTDVEEEKKEIQTSEVALAEANEALTEATTELNVLTGGATITYEQALLNKRNAETTKKEKEEAFNEISSLAANYSKLINEITTVSAKITQNNELITTIERNLVTLEADYNSSKAIFDANPSGKTVTDLGEDRRAGNQFDNSTVTYLEVLNANSNPVSFGNVAFFSSDDIPAGRRISTDFSNLTTGTYFNVEEDDTVLTNSEIFNNAQAAFINAQTGLSNAKSDLAENEAELAELREKESEFDTTLTTQVENARSEKDAAIVAFELAEKIITGLEGITSLENAIVTSEKNLEEAKQKLQKAESEVTRLSALVSDAKLAEYVALLDRIDALSLEVSLDQKTIADLQGDIAYFEGLELELEASNYTGADYKKRMEKIAEEIKDQEVTIIATTKSIAAAKNDLGNLEQDKVNLEDTRTADVAELEALIEKTEAEITQRRVLAEQFKNLMEEALAS